MRRDAAGFTLLEVLVALAVLGLLLGLLGGGVHLGLRAWNAQARALRAGGELDAVDRTLRRLIAGMDPGSVTVAPEVVGGAGGLLFTATLPEGAGAEGAGAEGAGAEAADGAGGLADILLTVDGRHRLLLRWTPHVHGLRLAPPPPPKEAVLLDGVARLELGYWPRAAPFGWRARWAEPALPGLVRLRLDFPEGDTRRWPEIVVAPAQAPRPG